MDVKLLPLKTGHSGAIFGYSDFYLSKSEEGSVAKALSRIAKEGTMGRLLKGNIQA